MGRRRKREKREGAVGAPERHVGFYESETESKRYSSCPQTMQIQWELADECVRVLLQRAERIPRGATVLNIGCGSGLCSGVISQHGLAWVGADISRPMLHEADEHARGLLLEADCFARLPFRDSVFEHGISVSAVQWICVSTSPVRTARVFFAELKRVLKNDAVFVAQLYPRHQEDVKLLEEAADHAGWHGRVFTAFPHASKAKKKFLCLTQPVVENTTMQHVSSRVCPLSWPLQTPCGGSRAERLAQEHADYADHSLRLLRRAFLFGFGESCQEHEETYDVVDVACEALMPCGGNISVHRWHDEMDEPHDVNDMNDMNDVLRVMLGDDVKFSCKVVHGSKSGKPADWAGFNGDEPIRRSPHFGLRRVTDTPCGVLEAQRRSPLVAFIYKLSEARAFKEHLFALTSVDHSGSVVGIDIRGTDVAVLLYIPATKIRPLDDTIRTIFAPSN
jgi:SAM-dependent methyltransferase